MSKVKVQAIEPFNQYRPGDTFELSANEARQAADKGLVKMAGQTSNKMRADADNKSNPPKAAGGAKPSSASRAARPSRATTAKPSGAGGKTDAGDA